MGSGTFKIRNFGMKLLCSFDLVFKRKVRNGKLAIHCMFKDEAPFLKEWIDYHLSQGIDYIYLTNDGSSDNWESVVKPYAEQGLLEYENSIDYPDFYIREEHHKAAIWAKAQNQYEWIAFLDSDEFWYCEEGFSEVLNAAPAQASGLVFNWLVYGTAHMEELLPGDLMLEKLNRRFPDGHEENHQIKSVLRSGMGARFFNKNPHYPNYSPWAPLYWSDGIRFRPGQKRMLLKPGHIKHYWYRTERFFREVKRSRRQFFDGAERSSVLEDWHYRRSNAVLDPFPENALLELKRYREDENPTK